MTENANALGVGDLEAIEAILMASGQILERRLIRAEEQIANLRAALTELLEVHDSGNASGMYYREIYARCRALVPEYEPEP